MAGFLVMALLGEYLCVMREMRDIPLGECCCGCRAQGCSWHVQAAAAMRGLLWGAPPPCCMVADVLLLLLLVALSSLCTCVAAVCCAATKSPRPFLSTTPQHPRPHPQYHPVRAELLASPKHPLSLTSCLPACMHCSRCGPQPQGVGGNTRAAAHHRPRRGITAQPERAHAAGCAERRQQRAAGAEGCAGGVVGQPVAADNITWPLQQSAACREARRFGLRML